MPSGKSERKDNAMKNIFKRLHRRKGFTLIECIVALAVFAALVLVVFAILTNARVVSKNANETEENLTLLVGNVVDDETYRKYTSDTEVLNLNISGAGTGTFKISYNEIDGYKNFILCPNCGEFTDNISFMPAGTKQENFTQTTKYKCPTCKDASGNEYEFECELKCDDCDNEGKHTDTTKFTYVPLSGGFYCNACGGLSVKDKNVNEKVASEMDLVVTGMIPNAIKYGDVPQGGAEFDKFSVESSSGTQLTPDYYNVDLEYNSSSNMSLPGTYELSVSANGSELSGLTDLTITIPLPKYYNVVDFKVPSNGTATYSNYNAATDEAGYIKISGCTNSSYSHSVEFRLANFKSGISFEDDYNGTSDADNNGTYEIADYEKQGLGGYWFGGTSASSVKINDAGYVDKIVWNVTINS